MSELEWNNVFFVPSIHQRMIFAGEVRWKAASWRPDCVAVELPPALKEWVIRGVLRLPQISAVCHPSARGEGEMSYVPVDPCDSMIEAVRIACEREIDVEFIDGGFNPADSTEDTMSKFPLPDDLMIEKVGLEAYVKTVLPFLSERADEKNGGREAFMARRLLELSHRHERVLCVLGIGHFARVRALLESNQSVSVSPSEPGETGKSNAPRTLPHGRGSDSVRGIFLAHVKPSSLPHLLREMPRLAAAREKRLAEKMSDKDASVEWRFDKMAALIAIFRQAGKAYTDQYKNEVSLSRFKGMIQYTRNLALVEDRLEPEAYHAVMAAKSAVDDDYGYEVWKMLQAYEGQEEESQLPILNLREGAGQSRGSFSDREEKFRMESLFDGPERESVKIGFRRRPSMEMKRVWKEQWDQQSLRGICSWPPEDETQEKFMTFLRKRAVQVVTEDKRQVVEFSTSLLDGLDIRETMRNWHTGKIFVQQTPQPQGTAGAVVLIFADEPLRARGSWRCTLYAENRNESDISFYATPPGENVVGPRISRTEFGGILSIYPAAQIPDIWSFPGIGELKSCADALLAGAILFSEDKFIAHVATKPPASFMREIAARHHKHIIHLPIRNFSESQLKKIRKFHILNGKDVRAFAADYIFD